MTSPMLRFGRPPAILASVVLWWLAVVLPGLLCVAGALGRVGTGSGTELTGALAATWIVGYLVQLALIYVVGHAVGHVRAWWFFVASLLPWVVDWAAAISVGTGLVAIAVAGAFASLMVVLALRSEALDSRGIQVEATVVKVLRNHLNVVINNVYIRRRVLLTYPLPDGTTTQKVLGMICEIGTSPSPGDHIALRVDPRDPRHIAVDPSQLAT